MPCQRRGAASAHVPTRTHCVASLVARRKANRLRQHATWTAICSAKCCDHHSRTRCRSSATDLRRGRKVSIHNGAPPRVLYGLEGNVSQIKGNAPVLRSARLGSTRGWNESNHIGGRGRDEA